MSTEMKATEGRRLEDEGELTAQTAFEGLQGAPLSALVTKSTLKSNNGSVELYECAVELASALRSVAEGIEVSRLSGALVRVKEVLREEMTKSGLVMLRKMPLHASRAFAKLMTEALFGPVLEVHDCLETRGLGNDATKGLIPEVICLTCCVPSNRSTTIRFASVDDVLLSLSSSTKRALKMDSHGGPSDDYKEPLLTYDDQYRAVLKYSTELKEAVEWHPDVSSEVCAALTDLDEQGHDPALGTTLPLRVDDIVFMNAKKWLYALTMQHDTSVGETRFMDGTWYPRIVLDHRNPKNDHSLLPSDPIILRHWVH